MKAAVTIIPITRYDLDNGEPGRAQFCPVSRAMKRAGWPDVRIYCDWFRRSRRQEYGGTVHPALTARIELIDNERFGPPQRIDPFTVIDLGTELRLGPA